MLSAVEPRKKPPKPGDGLDNVMRLSFKKSFKHRFPWLMIGLLGGILAAHIVTSFENVLSENLILAAFIPLIVYMSDAVGTQMEAFVIRDTALHSHLNFVKYFFKHFLVTAFIASILGLTLFVYSLIFNKETKISIVLSISMFLSVLSSVLTGLLLPRLFTKLKLDPANASGPVATILQDILSVLLYFSIASSLL